MKDFIEGEDPLGHSNVVSFPIDAKLAATRAYRAELDRYDRAEREGRRAQFNARIKTAYFSALFAHTHSPI
jgi:hypothetical protein